MGQNEGEISHGIDHFPAHPGMASDGTGKSDVVPRVGDDQESQLCRSLKNAQVPDIVDIHILINRMDLQSVKAQVFHASQFFIISFKIRMHAAQRQQAGFAGDGFTRFPFVDPCGSIVDLLHLTGRCGHRKDYRNIHAGLLHRCLQAGLRAIDMGLNVRRAAQLVNCS